MLISGDTPNEFMNKVLVGLETQKTLKYIKVKQKEKKQFNIGRKAERKKDKETKFNI